MITIYDSVLSDEDIQYLNTLPEVLSAKASLDAKQSGKVYFSVRVTDSIRAALLSRFGLEFSLDSLIPMRWIKGDTAPHIDTGASQFENTYLLYLNSSPGELIIDSQSYPIEANTGFVFNEGLNHNTINTGTEPRLLLGPMSEAGTAVGSAIIYYMSLADALAGINDIANSALSYEIGVLSSGDIAPLTQWLIASNSSNTEDRSVIYTNGTTLAAGTYNLYYAFFSRIIYYPSQADALDRTNPLCYDDSTFVIGDVAGGTTGGYTKWKIASNSVGPASQLVVHTNGDTLSGTAGTASYGLYPINNNITYYPSQADADAETNALGTSDTFVVGNATTGTNGGYTRWRIASNSSGPASQSVVHTNGATLVGTNNVDYYNLYPLLGNIIYYPSQSNALAGTNRLGYNTASFTVGNVNSGTNGGYTGWRIASNSIGSSSQSVVYTNGQILSGTQYTDSYNLYVSVPCFLEGTTILCQVDGVEKYVPVEQLKNGTLVKTTLDGFKKVVGIGKGSIQNAGNDERTENRLYKCSPSKYPALKEDLYITGCHSILEFPLTEEQNEAIIKHFGKLFATDKKYRLMACLDQRAEPWNSEGEYTIYHFALENTDILMNYGVYANGGLLVETCSINYIKNKSNMTLINN